MTSPRTVHQQLSLSMVLLGQGGNGIFWGKRRRGFVLIASFTVIASTLQQLLKKEKVHFGSQFKGIQLIVMAGV